MTKNNGEAGSVLLLVTFSLSALLGMVGLAVDLGWSYYRRQAAQAAAESAAIATTVAVQNQSGISCSSAVCQVKTACPQSPTAPPANNISSGCLYAAANGFRHGGSQTVMLEANLTSPSAAPGVSTVYWATATITESNPTLFSGILGNLTGSIAAQATAAIFQKPVPNCLYVLDPHASGSLSEAGGANIQTGCGVYVDSNSSSALSVTGQASLTAPAINVVGSYSSCNVGTNCYYNPSLPKTNQPFVGDPLASLPAPSYAGCSQTNFQINKDTTIGPGVYCNGIQISGQAHVTMQPGNYVLNGGGLKISGANATLSGSEVMIYNTANGFTYGPVDITGNSGFRLSAPTSGTYRGILFYQDRSITSSTTNKINGGTDPAMIGTLYFPTTPLQINGGSAPTPFQGLVVARTLTVTGGGSLFISLSGPVGTSGSSYYSALIQ